MGTGYTRNDTTNNIADGNVVNAADFDGEFDSIESAFATSGHTHDGTAAEGGPVTVVGPAQDIVVSSTNVNPKVTNTMDLGTSSLLYKDAYLQGKMYVRDTALYINSSTDGQLDIVADTEVQIAAPTVDINGAVALDGAITGATNITLSGNITVGGTVDGRDVATDGTKLDGIESGATADQTASEILTAIKTVDGAASGLDADLLDGQHGSYYAPLASPALTGTATAVNLTLSGDLTVNGTTTTLNTTNTVVSDNLIELNSGVSSNANDSGIVIERGTTGDNAFMGWDESADSFILGTTTATGASTGNLTITAAPLSVSTLTTTKIEATHNSNYVAKFTQAATSLSNANYTLYVDSSSHITNMTAAGAFGVEVNSGVAFSINGFGNATFNGSVDVASTSNPILRLTTTSTTSDPIMRYDTGSGSASDWATGIDVSSNEFVISTGTVVGSNKVLSLNGATQAATFAGSVNVTGAVTASSTVNSTLSGEAFRLSGSPTYAFIRNTDGTTNQWFMGSGGAAGLQHYVYQAQPFRSIPLP